MVTSKRTRVLVSALTPQGVLDVLAVLLQRSPWRPIPASRGPSGIRAIHDRRCPITLTVTLTWCGRPSG